MHLKEACRVFFFFFHPIVPNKPYGHRRIFENVQYLIFASNTTWVAMHVLFVLVISRRRKHLQKEKFSDTTLSDYPWVSSKSSLGAPTAFTCIYIKPKQWRHSIGLLLLFQWFVFFFPSGHVQPIRRSVYFSFSYWVIIRARRRIKETLRRPSSLG